MEWVDLAFEELSARKHAPERLTRPFDINELPTPALVLERSVLQANLARMAASVAGCNKGIRPHTKTHKCPHIASLQIETGAVGVCAAKVSEAAALVLNGISQVLITSPITHSGKLMLLDKLTERSAELMLVVDSSYGLGLLEETISGPLGVLIDLDVAMGRTGTRDITTAMRLIERIDVHPHLHFQGFQHYAGHVMHMTPFAERSRVSLQLWEQVTQWLQEVEARSIDYGIVTGCGTGTYNIDVNVPVITDLQVGSYIFMDAEYIQIGGSDGGDFNDFGVALTVAATAISQPTAAAITLDCGYKSMASETVMPLAQNIADVEFRFAGDEHGVLIGKGVQGVPLGSVVQLVNPHCDPTVNLHDYYWIMEADGQIHERWPITGRGLSW